MCVEADVNGVFKVWRRRNDKFITHLVHLPDCTYATQSHRKLTQIQATEKCQLLWQKTQSKCTTTGKNSSKSIMHWSTLQGWLVGWLGFYSILSMHIVAISRCTIIAFLFCQIPSTMCQCIRRVDIMCYIIHDTHLLFDCSITQVLTNINMIIISVEYKDIFQTRQWYMITVWSQAHPLLIGVSAPRHIQCVTVKLASLHQHPNYYANAIYDIHLFGYYSSQAIRHLLYDLAWISQNKYLSYVKSTKISHLRQDIPKAHRLACTWNLWLRLIHSSLVSK